MSQWFVLVSLSVIVDCGGRWLIKASESTVFGTALGRKGGEPQAPPPSGGQGIALPQVSSPRAWCSTGVPLWGPHRSVRQSAHRPAPRVRSAFHGGLLQGADALGQAALPEPLGVVEESGDLLGVDPIVLRPSAGESLLFTIKLHHGPPVGV
jgi:hypothetical protein